jgi:hypothetical protein
MQSARDKASRRKLMLEQWMITHTTTLHSDNRPVLRDNLGTFIGAICGTANL